MRLRTVWFWWDARYCCAPRRRPGALDCSGCHGAGPQPPALTNRVPEEIVVALDAFRAGTRPATVMDRIANGFSHDESVAIAVWVAAPNRTLRPRRPRPPTPSPKGEGERVTLLPPPSGRGSGGGGRTDPPSPPCIRIRLSARAVRRACTGVGACRRGGRRVRWRHRRAVSPPRRSAPRRHAGRGQPAVHRLPVQQRGDRRPARHRRPALCVRRNRGRGHSRGPGRGHGGGSGRAPRDARRRHRPAGTTG